MAALQCEICGGKLVGKPGGVFECDSCGMEYSTEWAKAKIQEIKGTVKVEGTVEVTGKVQVEGGTVQVEGTANKESLLKRGQLALEDKKWAEADGYFDKVLDIDPECAEAYLGKLLAELKVSGHESLRDEAEPFDGSEYYKKVLRFGNETLVNQVESMNESIIARNKAENTRRLAYEEAKSKELAPLRVRSFAATKLISAGEYHTVGLKADGTVVAVGDNGCGQCDVSEWRDIIAVAAGSNHTVGLKSDGTVTATTFIAGKSHKDCGQCRISCWRDIVAIAAGDNHTVGLRSDGTVVAAGADDFNQCKVYDWRDIIGIAAKSDCTFGFKADGTVVTTGLSCGCEEVSTWSDIVSVDCGAGYSVGLKSDGTVIANKVNDDACDVSEWRDIIAIATGAFHTAALKADGTVVAVGENYKGQCDVGGWRDIVAVAAGKYCHSVGLKPDGTVVTAGYNYNGCCNVSDWKLFSSIDTLEEEREAARAAKEKARQAQIAKLEAEKSVLNTELANLKGMFSGKRRKEIEARLAAIDAELAKLK